MQETDDNRSFLSGGEMGEQTREAIERKQAEELLCASEARLALAIDIARLGYWEYAPFTGALTASAQCKANFGRKADEPFSYDELRAAIHPDDRDRQVAAVAHALESKAEFEVECRVLTPDGELRWIAVRGRFEGGAGGPQLVGVTLDITERKRAEAVLRESQDRLAIELTDMERLHALGTRLMQQNDLAAVLHEVLTAAAELLRVDKGSVQIYDRRDQVLRLVSAIGFDQDFLDQFRVVDAGGSTTCAAALRQGEQVIVEDLAMNADFGELARAATPHGVLAAQSTPFFSSDGKLSGMLTTYFDQPRCFSERELRLLDLYAQQAARQIERKQAEEALRESEQRFRTLSETLERRVEARTAELQRQAVRLRRLAGELTSAEQRERKRLAAILHDGLQQLLVAAKMRLHQAHGQVGDPATRAAIEGVVDLLGQAVDSSRNLTRALRPPTLYEDGLLPALRWLASELVRLHDLHVVIDGEDTELPLSDDLKALLFESIRELLFNVAKHAGVNEATVRVRQDGERLRVAVADEGVGFDVEAAAREEDPQQPGMGLFSIRERLAALGGGIALESIPGVGTRIELTVSLAPAEGEESAVPAERFSPAATHSGLRPLTPTRQARVLVVDDHALVREGIANVLSGDKRLVVVGEAADGVEAIEAVARHRPDVVLIDVNMPRMNGVEATREIRRRWPEVRIVALSVQDDAATMKAMIAAGAAAFVSKSDKAGQISDAVFAPIADGWQEDCG